MWEKPRYISMNILAAHDVKTLSCPQNHTIYKDKYNMLCNLTILNGDKQTCAALIIAKEIHETHARLTE